MRMALEMERMWRHKGHNNSTMIDDPSLERAIPIFESWAHRGHSQSIYDDDIQLFLRVIVVSVHVDEPCQGVRDM